MLVVGLTGGIGSGKSTVARIFSALGIPVFHSDSEAKKILSDTEIISKIVNVFGKEIISKEGTPDRKKIASIAFSDKEKLARLNSIMHPAVKETFKTWLQAQNSHYVIKEAAILFESGTYKDCDKIIVVTAPEELRKERVLKRDGISDAEFDLRAGNQWADEEKKAKADYLILNDESALLIPQVLEIHKNLSR